MSDRETIEAAAAVLGDLARRGEPLGPHTTYRVGGAAALYLAIDDAADLEFCGRVVAETDIDVLVVGNGSNLLVCDSGFSGLAVALGESYARVTVDGTEVTAGGAALLPVVARQSVAAGLTGFEWAVGVPGSIGGAVRMNAGGHGSDMAAHLLRVRVFDTRTGETSVVESAQLDLGYRRSALRPHQVVTEATLGLTSLPDDADGRGAELLREIVRWRRANQPGGANAGSVFTNPPGDSAGRLVDAAGYKGVRRGTAAVSDKHANFIQADPDGRADDVYALMMEVRDAVEVHSGIRLHPETVLVGFEDGDVS